MLGRDDEPGGPAAARLRAAGGDRRMSVRQFAPVTPQHKLLCFLLKKISLEPTGSGSLIQPLLSASSTGGHALSETVLFKKVPSSISGRSLRRRLGITASGSPDRLRWLSIGRHFSQLRQCKYLNNIVEQDHRQIKRLVRPGLGFGSVRTARRTLAGYEAMVRKGQVRNIGGRDMRKQAAFVTSLFRVAA
jgi:hypothetical protein